MTDQIALANRCTEVAQLTRDALAWVEDPENAETVQNQAKGLVKLLRRGARRAERLSRSARTKMSVSVFGPSQAGKSFLVSVLARPKNGRLTADFNGPGGQLDYISEINPAGDGESTGLVTRFTMSKDSTPEGFPIRLTLLSEADIARTIINSFFKDGDQSETPPDADQIGAHLKTFEAKAGAVEVPGLGFEDVFETAEYIENTFSKAAYAAALKSFFDEAAVLAPRMSITDRGAFLSILWGGYQPLTDLYVQLATALAKVGHAEEVFAPLSALTPREASIIDVATLHGLFGGDSDTLKVRTGAGQESELSRAVLCALAAELVFPMVDQPSDLFAETDLLDFPGARNRFEQPLTKTLETPEETVTQMLLRGKVAYLFDRYVANQEITSMLLCVPDSNMETLDLPPLVEHWIGMTHGTSPKQRANTDCILFFVMTKFDKHLGDSASGGTASERFERRMKASLLEAFGKIQTSWVHEWTQGQPFNNCYWLRNPNYFVEGLIEYTEDSREARIRPEKEDRVAELKSGCLATEAVQAHFREPERAWNSALTLNDGGVGYLTDELTRVCKPASKVSQIISQLDKLVHSITVGLSPYFVSDDIGKRIDEKRALAGELIDGLELTLQNHRFGAFLSNLCVDQDGIQDRISRVPASIRISNAVHGGATPATPRPADTAAGAPIRPGAPARPLRPGASITARPASTATPETENELAEDSRNTIRTMTPEAFQADGAIEVWAERLDRFQDDTDALSVFQLAPERVADLVAELMHGFRRLHCRETVMQKLSEINFGLTVDKQAPPAAIVCGEVINGFVETLGIAQMAEEDRPRIELPDGSVRTAFDPRVTSDTADDLPMDPRPAASDTWTDWVFALEALLVGNAKDGNAGSINIEQNLRLGAVLTGLQGEAEE